MEDFEGKIPARQPEEIPGRRGSVGRVGDQDMVEHATWVDLQIRAAMRRGAFDDLPGAGRPIEDLETDGTHDPDWWVRRLVKREQITGVLPPALTLRIEDARLEEAIDRECAEAGVREIIEEFNRRVVQARRQLLGGPPVITPTRDADREVELWRERRMARRRA